MHDRERIKPRSQIVYHNARALGQPLKPSNRKRLEDIEDTEKYKAREKSFPSERDGDERNQLSSGFVNDNELWVFRAAGACYQRSRGNSNEG